jgi:diguanylate cyclase (GGDEF)-like protein/PAS domain S-box-containing protein
MRDTIDNPRVLIALAVSYALLAAGAIALTRLSGGVALLWVATAPLIALLAARPARRWPALILAAMVGNITAGIAASPLSMIALPISIANMTEAMIAAALLRHWQVSDSPIGSMRSVALFVLAAGVAAPALSGLIGAGVVSLTLTHRFASIWLDWVIGHGLGSLIATPLVLLALHSQMVREKFPSRWRIAEMAGHALLIAGVASFVFAQDRLPLLFVVSLPVLIATTRFHRLGAIAGVAIVAVIGGGMTLLGHGPVMLVQGAGGSQLQFFQLFLAVQFLIALPVASLLSQRAHLFAALSDSEARYRMLADQATDAMLTLKPDGTIRFASAAARELGLYDPEALVGRNALALVIPEDRDHVREVHLEALRIPGESLSVEYRIAKANGEIGWFESNMRAVADATGQVRTVVSVVREIEARKAREADLERQATTDPLTGLLNRGAIRARIDAAARAEGPPAILALVDLDHFKAINDTHGHATGDAVLLGVADLVHENIRPGDWAGRIGGEEFALLFAGVTLAQAQMACDRLARLLAEAPLAMGRDGPIFVTMSAGLVSLGGDPNAAFRAADAALYRAKANGRNRVELAEAC